MRKNILFAAIAILLTIFSCEDDDKNLPPNEFFLLTVGNGATDINLTPRLTWSMATDPDGDTVTYDLILDNNQSPNTVVASNLEGTEFTFSSPLQFLENYSWKVIAKDSYGNTTESNIFSFTTIANKPPNEFFLLTISNGATDINLTPRLTWSMAIDPEEDTVTYDLILDNNQNPDTVVASNLEGTEFTFSSPLQFLENYSWKVIAKDSYGNTTESNIFSFTTIANKPPNEFFLLTISNGATDINLTPRLTWSMAIDPEEDTVTYDLILDNNQNPDTVIASNLEGTEYTFNSPLRYSEDFYWKIIAKDSYGNTTESNIFRFTTIDLFQKMTESSAFSGRLDHETIIFKDKMWLIGGTDNNFNSKNDVWSSSNGTDWTQVIANANFSSRASHSAVTYDNKMWVIGGYAFGNKNDVWSSSDGLNWTQMTSNANFSPRYAHTSVVFNDKILVIGGEVGSLTVLNDIWQSNDGVNWTQISSNTAPKKGRHAAVVFDNKIWLVGGLGEDGLKNDVWNSNDGINWTLVTSNAPFSKRYYHTLVVYDNKLWLIGGIGGGNNLYNDIWNSADGINWTKITSDAAFSPRDLHTSVIYDNKIWVIAGRDSNTRKNDVWKMK